jgi:RND family efflux transporter MFP subunit
MSTQNVMANIVLAVAVGILSGCRRQEAAKTEAAAEAVPVSVWKVQHRRITQRIEATGDVKPLAVVHLAAKVAGRLERLGTVDEQGRYAPISEGSRVQQGESVAQIDLAVYEARFRQAQAALAMAEAQARDAEREAQRVRQLFEQGSATEQMRDKAETGRDVAQAALAQAKAAFELARMEFDEARLKSPVTGVVTRKHVDEGNLVAVGMPLLTIEDMSQVKIVASVAERYLPYLVESSTRAEIQADALPSEGMEAVVSKVYPAIDPVTRTATIEILLNNAEGRLRSGNFVHVRLDLKEVAQAVVIPLSAMSWQGRDAFVFVVENGKAVRRPVQVGIREMNRCEIVDGLKPGEALVVEGSRNLKDGDAVRAQEVSLP